MTTHDWKPLLCTSEYSTIILANQSVYFPYWMCEICSLSFLVYVRYVGKDCELRDGAT